MNECTRKTSRFRRGLVQNLALLAVLCVYFSSLHLSANTSFAASNKVFCPLQKTWVKKNVTEFVGPKESDSLKDICASDGRKKTFADELFSVFRSFHITANQQQTEKLFFSYYKQGRSVIAAFVSSHEAPEQRFIAAAKAEKGINNSRPDVAAEAIREVVPQTQPRPPTSITENLFVSQTPAELKTISRRIKPRAPPFSI